MKDNGIFQVVKIALTNTKKDKERYLLHKSMYLMPVLWTVLCILSRRTAN